MKPGSYMGYTYQHMKLPGKFYFCLIWTSGGKNTHIFPKSVIIGPSVFLYQGFVVEFIPSYL